MPNPLEKADLTRDRGMVEAVRGDPLYHNIVSARLGWDIMEWCRWLEDQAGAFPVPLLVMQGSDDRIVNPAATVALAGRLSGMSRSRSGTACTMSCTMNPSGRQ